MQWLCSGNSAGAANDTCAAETVPVQQTQRLCSSNTGPVQQMHGLCAAESSFCATKRMLWENKVLVQPITVHDTIENRKHLPAAM